MKRLLSLAVITLSLGSSLSIFGQAYTPKAGSSERTAILDVVRKPLEKAVLQKVVFVVDQLKVDEEWAFLIATPQAEEGGKIKYTGTEFEEEARDADELTVALLKKEAGSWTLVEHAYFTTDVWSIDIEDRYPNCPTSILVR